MMSRKKHSYKFLNQQFEPGSPALCGCRLDGNRENARVVFCRY